MNVININISGTVQVGKSAVLQSIKDMLESRNYCVAVPCRDERNNPSDDLDKGVTHEIPGKDSTVFVLSESVEKS